MAEHQSLATLANRLVLLFVVTNLLSLGMSLTVKEIVEPLRNVSLTIKALIANFVVVPLLGYLLVRLTHREHGIAIGLILLATAAGDPFFTKASQMVRGDPAYTVALMMMLQFVAIIYMPLVLPMLLPGVKVDPLAIAKPLIVVIALPLVLGLLVKARFERVARLLCVPLDRASSVFSAVALTMIAVIYFKAVMADWGARDIGTAVLFVWVAFGVGYALGGPSQLNRSVLGLGTSIRGYSAALVVAVSNFRSDYKVLLLIVIALIAQLATFMPIAIPLLRRKRVGNVSKVAGIATSGKS
jgi:BASS family bile acid:Na+ symporter